MRASSSTTSRLGVGAGPGGGHQPGGVPVVGNFGSGPGFLGMSPAMTGLRGGASGQPHSMIRSKNEPTGAHPLAVRLGRDRPACPGTGGQPQLVVLDVVAGYITDRGDPGVSNHTEQAGAAHSRPRRRSWAPGTCRAAAGSGASAQRPGARRPRSEPTRHRHASRLPLAGRDGAHRAGACCAASIWATASASASISSDACRYCLARCK